MQLKASSLPTIGLAGLIAASGCAPRWQPSMDLVQPFSARTTVSMADFQLPGPHRFVYLRRNLRDRDAPALLYRRDHTENGWSEGALIDVEPARLGSWLVQPLHTVDGSCFWPKQARTGARFVLELDPPLEFVPDEVTPGRIADACVDLRLFDPQGRLRFTGQAKRRVELEGLETITSLGTTYRDCVRLRVETDYLLRYGPRIHLTTYLWSAASVGEVRRVEHYAGSLFLPLFDEVFQFDLVSTEALEPSELPVVNPDGCRAWSGVAIYLDRWLPHPRLGGAVVTFASTAKATRPDHAGRLNDAPGDTDVATCPGTFPTVTPVGPSAGSDPGH